MSETTNAVYFDFIEKRMISLIIFIVLTTLGIVSYFSNGITLGTDFSGGIRIEFTVPTTVQEIRELVNNDTISITTLSLADGTQSFLLTAPAELAQDGSGDYLLEPIREKFNAEQVAVLASDYVGPSVGDDFIIQSLRLLGIVTLLILVYVAFRFDFVYGVGATMALIHDMVILLIFTVLFKIPVDLTILAAFLTILGYSINDTIVIFDRVRENHNILPQENFNTLINKSITQTLKRTILTSITTLFVATAIYIWSGNILQNFGLLLMVGIISGTYSSIFVAAPISYELWTRKQNKK